MEIDPLTPAVDKPFPAAIYLNASPLDPRAIQELVAMHEDTAAREERLRVPFWVLNSELCRRTGEARQVFRPDMSADEMFEAMLYYLAVAGADMTLCPPDEAAMNIAIGGRAPAGTPAGELAYGVPGSLTGGPDVWLDEPPAEGSTPSQ